MKQQQLDSTKTQMHLHNNLKRWMNLSSVCVSFLVMLVYSLPVFWMKVVAGVVLAIALILWLILGFAVWRSRQSLLSQLSQLEESKSIPRMPS